MAIPTVNELNTKFMQENPQYSYNTSPTNAASYQPSLGRTATYAEAEALAQNQIKPIPTVLSNVDKIEKTIPELQAKGLQISNEVRPQPTTDVTGDFSYEKALKDALKSSEGQFETSPEQQSLMAMMRANIDAQTQASLSAIQKQYDQREKLLQEEQAAGTQSMRHAMAAQGFTQQSAEEALNAKTRYDIQTLSNLQADEEAQRGKVLQAQLDNNFQLMEKELNQYESVKKEKLAFAKQIADDLKKRNDEIVKTRIQSTRDAAIADLVDQGITSPSQIKALLDESAQASGYATSDFTAEEIGKALKVFKPDESLAGLDTDYRTYSYLRDIGDPAVKGLNYLQYKTAVANATRKPTEAGDDVLSVTEAKALGVPYGTTKSQAMEMDITPSSDEVSLTGEKKIKLLGAGFSEEDIKNIETDIREHGLEAVIDNIEEDDQKKALRDVYGVKEKVTREQVKSSVTQKDAYDGLKDAYTTDELKALADKYEHSSMWTNKDTDIERFLNSTEARTAYADLLYSRYEEAGLAK